MNSFITVDADRCIGCRTCEIACAVSHSEGGADSLHGQAFFSPRLRVVRSAKITLPVLCRQCDNAPCANACPTEAIVWNDNSIQVIQNRCIGCKSCAVACPFGAMTVITESTDSTQSYPAKSEALKCDLCSHSETGPACVRVCPTNALRLVDNAAMEKMIKEKRDRTVYDESSVYA